MLKSMTGYGRGEANASGCKFTVELKSVNHRFCEVVVRLPRIINSLEERIRKMIQTGIKRGRVDVYISMEDTEKRASQVKVDKELAVAYYKSMEELQRILPVAGKIELRDLINLPNIFVVEEREEDLEELWQAIEIALNDAIEQLIQMRTAEGARLADDIKKRVGIIADLNNLIKQRSPLVVEEYKERLTQRLAEWQGEGMLDENRMAAEISLFAERSNITEEIVRLDSHLKQVEKCLQSDEAVGRKLDFLMQEMNREINTIGSKANDLTITNAVVDVKSELEKIREQVQNIE